jgi:lipopolysaccharide transport system permease protein
MQMDEGKTRGAGYFQRLWKLRFFLFSLVGSDLRARYRRSVLGLGWSLIRPLSMTLVLCVVFQKLFAQDNTNDYPPYVLLGLTVWQFLTENMLGGCRCFTNGSAYIRQQPIPLVLFPLRTVLGTGFHALVGFAVGLVVTWYCVGFGNLPVLHALIPSMVVLFLLGLFLAILCGTLQVHFPDTCHMLEIFLQFLFYLTPIIYPLGRLQERARLMGLVQLNPFYYILDLVRVPIVDGRYPPLQSVAIGLACVAVLGLLACVCLKRFERTLVFWV